MVEPYILLIKYLDYNLQNNYFYVIMYVARRLAYTKKGTFSFVMLNVYPI